MLRPAEWSPDGSVLSELICDALQSGAIHEMNASYTPTVIALVNESSRNNSFANAHVMPTTW